MDRISLAGIDVHAHHGVLPAERELGQRFLVDVDLWADCSRAAASDDLADAVDYAQVHRVVVASMTASPCRLLEAAAGRLCDQLLAGFQVDRVRVTVTKVHPPIAGFRGHASVTLERGRDGRGA